MNAKAYREQRGQLAARVKELEAQLAEAAAPTTKPDYYYHFTGSHLRDGRPIPAVGEWLVHPGELEMCVQGLHASEEPWDALQYAPGEQLHLVILGGAIVSGDNKLVAERRKIIASVDATPLLRQHARESALSVIHLWDCPAVVKDYLNGDDTKRSAAENAAWSAAWSAARNAAWSAARNAAENAAWSAAWSAAENAAWNAAWSAAENAAEIAAWSAARKRFNEAVYAVFAGYLR